MDEKLEDLMLFHFNSGSVKHQEKNYVEALLHLKEAFKLALKLRHSIYMDKCAALLVDVCYEAVKLYLNEVEELSKEKQFHKCTRVLRKCKSIAKFGAQLEVHYNATKNSEIIVNIKTAITKNKENLAQLRKERFENFKNRCSDAAESVGEFMGDFISGVFSASLNCAANF